MTENTMRRSIAILMTVLLSATALGGCATTGAAPSPSRDGKCHGPDYNAPSCIYLF